MEEVAVNELSFVPDCASSVDGYKLFTDFFMLCAQYSKYIHKDIIRIWSSRYIKNDTLFGITFIEWFKKEDRSPKELRQFALNIIVNQRTIEPYPEYLYNDTPCQGLAVAGEFELLCLSFLSAGEWDVAEVLITRRTLNELTLDTVDEPLSVHHASAIIHLTQHEKWISTRIDQNKQERLNNITYANEFWSRREELFPNLVFCDNTLRQLEEIFLNTRKLRHVFSKLTELDRAISRWNTSNPFNYRQLLNATPESTSRVQQLEQELTHLCPDGESRIFVWHFRYTPDEGRIYFHPDQSNRRCYVGYIGSKIL